VARTVEEILLAVKTQGKEGVDNLNKEIAELEMRLTKLQNSSKGNVGNFKWFKDQTQALQNGKTAYTQLTTASNSYQGALNNITGSIGNFIPQLATVIALQKAWQVSLSSAKFDTLRDNFKGAESDIEAFRKATAETVTDGNLIALSNQATDLGVGLKQQAILFALSENAADKYGTGIEEGFQKVIMATEGNVRGLKSLGIQKEVYEKIVKDLAKAHGDEINNLDAEVQKEIRLQAIIQASGMTYEQATNKIKDSADEQEALIAIIGNLTTKYGGLVVRGLIPMWNALIKLPKAIEAISERFQKNKIILTDVLGGINNLTGGWLGLRKEAEEPIRLVVELEAPNLDGVWSQIQSMRTGNFAQDLKDASYWTGKTVEELEKLARSKGFIGLGKDTEAIGSNKSNITKNTGSKTKTEKEKELNFLEQLQEKVKKLQAEQIVLTGLLSQTNLKEYERLAINEKQLEIQKELAEIMKLQGISQGRDAFTTLRQASEMIKEKAQKTLSFSTEGEQGGGVEEKFTLDEIVQRGLSFASELVNILGIGADTFIGKLISGLQSAISLANSLISFLGSILNAGSGILSGGIFGVIGSLFSAPANPTSMAMAGNNSVSNMIRIEGNLSQYGEYRAYINGQQMALKMGDRNH
jgi:hypothetical protein